MRKIILIISVLAAIVIAASVFNFCTKQSETKKESYVHNNKMQKATYRVYLPSGERVELSIGCCIINGCCVIDGNFHVGPDTGTYHIQNCGDGWTWGECPMGTTCTCIATIPPRITVNDMLGLVNDPNFPVNFCVPCGGGATM